MKALAHFATLLLLFPFLIWQFLVFDRLLRLEYEKFRAAWEHDGCPPGFLLEITTVWIGTRHVTSIVVLYFLISRVTSVSGGGARLPLGRE